MKAACDHHVNGGSMLDKTANGRDLVTLDRLHHFGRCLSGQLGPEVRDCDLVIPFAGEHRQLVPLGDEPLHDRDHHANVGLVGRIVAVLSQRPQGVAMTERTQTHNESGRTRSPIQSVAIQRQTVGEVRKHRIVPVEPGPLHELAQSRIAVRPVCGEGKRLSGEEPAQAGVEPGKPNAEKDRLGPPQSRQQSPLQHGIRMSPRAAPYVLELPPSRDD